MNLNQKQSLILKQIAINGAELASKLETEDRRKVEMLLIALSMYTMYSYDVSVTCSTFAIIADKATAQITKNTDLSDEALERMGLYIKGSFERNFLETFYKDYQEMFSSVLKAEKIISENSVIQKFLKTESKKLLNLLEKMNDGYDIHESDKYKEVNIEEILNKMKGGES